MFWVRSSFVVLIVSVLLTTCVTSIGSASEGDQDVIQEMKNQLQQMQSRLMELEKHNQELQSRLDQQDQQVQQVQQQVSSKSTVSTATGPVEKPAVRSSFPVELYGYVKFTGAYDSARINDGNYARWVESDSVSRNDDQFDATANQSRFGLKFSGPDSGSMKTSGRVEIDFLGGGAENKANIRMRHAYAQLDWPDYDLSLLAGQTYDIISPLFPTVINQLVEWYAGNIGTRRPQLRLTKGFAIDEDSKLVFEGGFSRTIGNDMFAFDTIESGEDAGFPTMQGRVSYTFPSFNDKPATIGVSGHWGQEEVDLDKFDHSRNMDTWSANIDLTLPLMDKLALKGEAFIGENLTTYAGGIGQGVRAIDKDGNAANGKEYPAEGIHAKGGWMAFELGPWYDFKYTVGASIDDPEDSDLNSGMRSENKSVFGTAFWQINKAISTAVEVSYWKTDYFGKEDGDSMRFQAAIYYKF